MKQKTLISMVLGIVCFSQLASASLQNVMSAEEKNMIDKNCITCTPFEYEPYGVVKATIFYENEQRSVKVVLNFDQRFPTRLVIAPYPGEDGQHKSSIKQLWGEDYLSNAAVNHVRFALQAGRQDFFEAYGLSDTSIVTLENVTHWLTS